MSTNDIQRVATSATEGLKDDTELRLDVQQELISHIEDAVASCREDGMSETESVSEGLKAFGSVTDIAAELVSANRSRMRMRQLARLAMRALLVPASLAVAFWILAESIDAGRTAKAISAISDYGSLSNEDMGRMLCRDGISKEAAFLFWGDQSLKTDVERQRSIWEQDPTNKVFYGNYISILTAKQAPHKIEELDAFEKEVRRGEELDPDNARYNYLLAGVMMDLASDLDYVDPEYGKSEPPVLKVHDRELLDRAMAEMLKGGAKPFMDTYSSTMQALRFAELPRERSMVEHIGRIGFAAGMLLPDVTRQRNLARASSQYAKLLIAEGKEREAVPYLEAVLPMAKKGFEQSGTLIESLVSFAIARTASNNVAVLEQIGEKEKAAEMSQVSRAVVAVHDDYKARISSGDSHADDLVMNHGGILHGLLLPALGETVDEQDLAPGRSLEQTIMEKGWLTAFIAALLVLMLGFFAVSLSLRYTRDGESAPILLLPNAEQLLRVIVYSVLIPLGLFYIYTRHTDLAGREYSMRIWPRFFAELHLLTVVMLSVAAYQMQKLVDSRCRELGLETPGSRNYFIMFLISLIPFGLIVWAIAGHRNTAMFRGTVARSLIPILAMIIVLVGTCTHPYLINRETRFVQNDGILGIPEEGGFTRIEAHVTKQLNKSALEAMAAAEKEQ